MTDSSPSLNYEPNPKEAPSRLPGFLAWVVIICCVGLVMYRVSRMYKRAADQGITNPSSELQVQFLGKTAVGFDQMTGSMTPPATKPSTQHSATKHSSNPNADQMIQSMDQYASSPAEKLRTITVVAELKGADGAMKRIEELEKKNPPDAVKDDLNALRTIYGDGARGIDDAARQKLIDHHGFFGRLATVYGLPDNDSGRAALMKEATSAAALMIGMGIIVIVIIIAIVIAAITAIVLAALGMFKRLYVPSIGINSAFVEVFALYLVTFLSLGAVMSHFKLDALAWDWVAILLIPLGMAYAKWRGVSDAARGLGWYWGRGPLIEIPLGIFGYLAGVPVIVVGFMISLFLMKKFNVSPMHPIQKMLEGDWKHVLNLYGIACIFAPILEETMFRGALFNHMRRGWNWISSASLVAFIFAAIHPQGWTLIPALGSIAIVLAALREWRGALWAPVAAHATNNFLVLSLALMASR